MLIFTTLLILVYSIFETNMTRLVRLLIIGLVCSLILLLCNLEYFSESIFICNKLFKLNPINLPFIILMYLFFIYCLINNCKSCFNIVLTKPYILILLINFIGCLVLINANNLFVFFFVLEIITLSTILTNNIIPTLLSNKSALINFVYSTIASIFILLGIVNIYLSFGDTNLDCLSKIHELSNRHFYYPYFFLVIGLFIKLSLFPFQNWSINNSTNIPTVTNMYINYLPKLTIIIWIFNNQFIITTQLSIIKAIVIISIIMTSMLCIRQNNVVNILTLGSINTFSIMLIFTFFDYYHLFIIFAILYTMSHAIVFTLLLYISHFYYFDHLNSRLVPLVYNRQLFNPWIPYTYNILFIITLLSYLGLPPLPGFFIKYFVFNYCMMENELYLSLALIISSIIFIPVYAYLISYFLDNIIKYESYKESNIYPFHLTLRNRSIFYVFSLIYLLWIISTLHLDSFSELIFNTFN